MEVLSEQFLWFLTNYLLRFNCTLISPFDTCNPLFFFLRVCFVRSQVLHVVMLLHSNFDAMDFSGCCSVYIHIHIHTHTHTHTLHIHNTHSVNLYNIHAYIHRQIYMMHILYIYTYGKPTLIPTYIHTYIHIYIHAYIHTYTHIYTYIGLHTYTHTYIYIHTYMHTYTHTYVRTYVSTCLQSYARISI